MTRRFALATVAACAFAAIGATTASAQMTGAPASGYKVEQGMPASTVPQALREIGFEQHIGERLPLDVDVNEDGRRVRVAEYFRMRPVILVFAYYTCPMLCSQVITGLASAVDVLSLQPGRDFDVLVVSIDPRDTPLTAAAKKALFLERYRKSGGAEAAHFVTADEHAIRRLAAAAGFKYVWDVETSQFAHPTGVTVLTPDGRMARYLFGIEYGPRDLRLALVEASAGTVGTAVDTLLLYCYHYDPMAGGYGLAIMRVLRIAGASTAIALCAFVGLLLRREKRGRMSSVKTPR